MPHKNGPASFELLPGIFKKNHGRYGHRRIHTELLNQGWAVAKKTVLKLIRALELLCQPSAPPRTRL
ncbi:IS3 family transposase [Arthrobacter globiformis]|uniref:IS3 family transposase n=1 Tax=Arthrobacter globiformis TaxID=1665 RepID=UPI0027D89C98|nr:IS3 family transposase [Arthrobacter globiformis]